MMQAPEPAKRSPWGLRIAVVGGAMLLLGVILMSTQSETIGSVMDPREQHHDEPYIGTGTFPSEQPLNDTCYRFYQIAGEPEMSVELYRVDGYSLAGEVLEESNCMLDWQAMSTDGTEFEIRSSWVLNESGEYALKIACEEDCSETKGWLVSVNAIQDGLLSSTGLVAGGVMCCIGVFTTPVALIIYFASKPSKSPRVMMVGADGNLVPITDVNPDHPTMFIQPEEDTAQQQKVAPPFADTAERQPSETYVDGSQDVSAGALLTTEQIYALMRGDVEGAQSHARDGRFRSTTAEETIQDAANAAAIASWDEGVPLAEPQPVQRTSTKAKQTPTQEKPAKNNDAWKDWDEL